MSIRHIGEVSATSSILGSYFPPAANVAFTFAAGAVAHVLDPA